MELFQDLCYGWRVLAKNWGFTAVVIITLGLGVGVSTAIFGVIEALNLRNLPVRDPKGLVQLIQVFPDARIPGFPYPAFEEFRDNNKVLSDLCAFTYLERADVVVDGEPGIIRGLLLTSDDYFSVLGLNAIIGTTFAGERSRSSVQNAVAVISFDYWRRQFGGRRSVLAATRKLIL